MATEKEIQKMRKAKVAEQKKHQQAALRKLSGLRKTILESFGKGALSEAKDQVDLSAGGWTTGLREVDDILSGQIDEKGITIEGSGCGLPKGRIIEIYGPESVGKTTLALACIAQAQKRGAVCAYNDVEHALDVNFASKLGVDVDSLLISQPDTAEQALSITEQLVKSGIDIIVVDSVAALIPEVETKGEMGDAHMGVHARLMSQACRKINRLLKPGGPTVIFINQIRMKLGVMFGNPETTPGGNALKFYASVRIDLRMAKQLQAVHKGRKMKIGQRVKLHTIKNKVVPPHRETFYDLFYAGRLEIPSEEDLAKMFAAWAKRNEK